MHDHTRGASTGSQHGYELHAGFISNPRGNPQRVSINDQSERGRAQKQWRLTSSTAVHWSRPWRSRGLRQYLNPPNRAQRCSSSGICPEQAFDLLISSAYLHGRGTHRVGTRSFSCLDPLSLSGDHMAKKSSKRRQWTRDDVRELKASARQKTPARKIARALRRTEGATRQKAFSLGISLDSR